MLREIKALRQNSVLLKRRWFTDADMDLCIWFNNQVPVSFQLSYDKRRQEHAISWHHENGFSLSRVDDGEYLPAIYKMTPLLFGHGCFDVSRVARDLLLACDAIDPSLADFVYARLLEFPRINAIVSGRDTHAASY
jgi:hypothetical protein